MVSFLFLFHVKGLHHEEEVDLLKERGGVVEDAAGLAVQGDSKFLAGFH